VQLIEQEKQHPRCDVFWNNELLGTLSLQEQGLLEPYQGSGWRRIPERFRDPAGDWVGFAARLRVWIVNTKAAAAEQKTVDAILDTEPSRAAFAQPMFGTTLTHYSVLWHLWGEERLREWHNRLRQGGLREVKGNAIVKDLVVSERCDAGATDTDDVFVAIDDHKTVDMLPIRVEGKTIAIPNTVAIVKGTKHREAAEKLVDYLTSAETELALAKSKSRQIPLGAVDDAAVPADVLRLREWTADSVDLRPLLPARNACLKWLREESAQ
jgi:iron(III) transport system substrate-binding protein